MRINRSLVSSLALVAMAFTLTTAASAQYTETLNVVDIPGLYPAGTVTIDAAGNIYGTLAAGGNGQCYPYGCGTVYEIPAGSTIANLIYTFSGTTDGGGPLTRLTFDAKGNLYGVAGVGGNMSACGGQGCGVVFELSPSADGTWTETVLYAFLGGTDGISPSGGVVFDAKGNLFGETNYGGDSACSGCGTVFELSPTSTGSWTESILHTFTGTFDGMFPTGTVTLDSRGNVYGSTVVGGTVGSACPGGCGVVYRLARSAGGTWNFTRLYAFNGARGSNPNGDFVFDAAGNLYGTTSQGGKTGVNCPYSTCGTVFELSRLSNGGWNQSLLHGFTGGPDGANPRNGVTLDAAGNVYGTAAYGGPEVCTGFGYPPGCGTAYKLTPATAGGWIFELIYGFTGGDGEIPNGNLVIDVAGNLYGTSVVGFIGYGNIFELSPPVSGTK